MLHHWVLVLQYVRTEFPPVFASMLSMVETVLLSESPHEAGIFLIFSAVTLS